MYVYGNDVFEILFVIVTTSYVKPLKIIIYQLAAYHGDALKGRQPLDLCKACLPTRPSPTAALGTPLIATDWGRRGLRAVTQCTPRARSTRSPPGTAAECAQRRRRRSPTASNATFRPLTRTCRPWTVTPETLGTPGTSGIATRRPRASCRGERRAPERHTL